MNRLTRGSAPGDSSTISHIRMIGKRRVLRHWHGNGNAMTNERGESMERYHVIIQQGDNEVHFAFNQFGDAQEFAFTCMETCDKGSRVIYYEDEDK